MMERMLRKSPGQELAQLAPGESLLFHSAATVLESRGDAPVGRSGRRFFQRRATAMFTDRRIIVHSTPFVAMSIVWLSLGAIAVYRAITLERFYLLLVLIVVAAALWQRRPYRREIEYSEIRGAEIANVQGLTAQGELLVLKVQGGSVQIVTVTKLPDDVRALVVR